MTYPQSYSAAPTLAALNKQLIRGEKSWRKVDSCPACAYRPIRDFARIRHMPYSRCHNCGFTFANPVPPDDILRAFYNSSFYSNYRRLEATRIARDPYFSISMYTDMPRLASWLGEDKACTVLDFGCGPGSFLGFLHRELGFSNVEGIEINSDSVEMAKKDFDLDIASSADQLRHKSYDFVLLLEVIEHLPSPDVTFKEIAELVKPGGQVLITTPAVDNLLGSLLPSYCPHYTAPSHVSLFTKKAMSSLLSRFGFEIERMEIDESLEIIEKLAASCVCSLDFASPSHDDDANDQLYTPNRLGHLLGHQPQRDIPRGRLGRAFKRVDRLLRRIPQLPRNNHLYVLARKGL